MLHEVPVPNPGDVVRVRQRSGLVMQALVLRSERNAARAKDEAAAAAEGGRK